MHNNDSLIFVYFRSLIFVGGDDPVCGFRAPDPYKRKLSFYTYFLTMKRALLVCILILAVDFLILT